MKNHYPSNHTFLALLMGKYGLHAKLVAAPGNSERLAHILLRAARLLNRAKGCRLCMVSRDAAHENTIWITELWDTQADHVASLAMEGMEELISHALPLLAEKPENRQELNVLGGYGI